MEKVLIISYYWPPSGGAGVQRWLKLSKYLALEGVEVHIVTVNPEQASYMQLDASLCEDVHPLVQVHTTRSFEPINYYAKLIGKSNVPTAGFSNKSSIGWKQKIVNSIRSHIFIPDPRRGWNRFAYKKAKEVINAHDIKYVITTSPPHSTQLVGLKLKRKMKDSIKWVADFRDPWTDIYYYNLLCHSFLSHYINKRFETKVIEQSDNIITVGERFKATLLSKTKLITEDKIHVIPNGFDTNDFAKTQVNEPLDSVFTIAYTGTISEHYEPKVFFKALGKLINKHPDSGIQIKLVGVVSEKIKEFILSEIGSAAVFIPPVSHTEAIDYMLRSNALLLITQGEEGTIPGKTFEYLASRRRIICIGTGDAAIAISNCAAGKSFDRSEENEIFHYLEEAFNDFQNKKPFVPNTEVLNQYSREYQAKQVLSIIKN